MSGKRYRWIQERPSSWMVGRQPQDLWSQTHAVRNRATHPLARWRMAVSAAFEPLVLAIIPLILWGMIARTAVPMTLGIGLSAGLVLLVSVTLIISVFAADAGAWQPGDAR